VPPAWYQTMWFHGCWIVAFVLLLFWLHHLRLRQVARQFAIRLDERVGERTRIARELHDTLLQSFHGLMFEYQAARNMLPRAPEQAMEALDNAILGTEHAIAESRDAIRDLRPQSIAEEDLPQLLKRAGEELMASRGHAGNPPSFEVIIEGARRCISPTVQDEVFRAARELIRNAFNHSDATRIEVELRYGAHELRLRVRDNGKGIDSTVVQNVRSAGHWGLPGVRERAEQIGSRVEIWSQAGAGTEIQLIAPAAIAYGMSSHPSRSKRFQRGGTA
jgi:signal transduction histidine kinase